MAILTNGELVLYGFVGENYWGDGFTASDVLDALAEHGRDQDITVRINSGGGYVDDGVAIYNALVAHKGKVTVMVDAMAASSASVIAMAGDERIMRKGAMMMIHDPSAGVWGTAEDMAKAVQRLEKQADNLASIYADVTGDDVDDIRADMKAETWLTADEAVERGFATSLDTKKAKATAAHDYSVYAHAPDRLVALAKTKNWSHERPVAKVSASAQTSTRPTLKEDDMTVQTAADNRAADADKAISEAAEKARTEARDRIKAIMTSEDAKGRESLAEHFAYETSMSAEAAVAALKAAPKTTATAQTDTTPATYEQQRLASTALATARTEPGKKSGLTAAVDNQISALKKR